jgi:hypothetical protein
MHSYSGFLRNTGSPICGVIKAAPVNILFWVPLFRGHPMMDGSIISQGADYFKMFITSTCLIKVRYFITFHYRGGLQIINFSRLLSSMELILESACQSRIKYFRKGSEKSPVRGTIPNN